jgi:hypothetical protein
MADALDDTLEALLATARDVASYAINEFGHQPMVKSARGGIRVSPWFKVWHESIGDICRLVRVLRMAPKEPASLEQELDRLMQEQQKER